MHNQPGGVPQKVGGFVLDRKIAHGGCSHVYRGRHSATGERVAVKVAPAGDPSLASEASVYRALRGVADEGFAKVHWYGTGRGVDVLVLDLLRRSVAGMFAMADRHLPQHTLTTIARQTLCRLRSLHERSFIHGDIKPENLMLSDAGEIFLIDFGLSKPFVDPTTGQHVPPGSAPDGFSGSPEFASCSALRGMQQSRRDDLESLGYVLLFLSLGRLPWQGLETSPQQQRLRLVAEAKQAADLSSLCRREGVHPGVHRLMCYARHLPFDAAPDYDLLLSWFEELPQHEHKAKL